MHGDTCERNLSIGARLVVGADGLRSVVARRLRLARVGRWPRRIALVAHYRGIEGMQDCGEMHVERDGYAGLADVGGGVTNVAVVVPARRGREIAAIGTMRFTERWLHERAQLEPRFRYAESVRRSLPAPICLACTSRVGARSALVGDAADFFDRSPAKGSTRHCVGRSSSPSTSRPILDTLGRRVTQAYDRARTAQFRGQWVVERLVGGAVASAVVMNRAAKALAARRDLADLSLV